MTAQQITNSVREIVQETDPNNCHHSDSLILDDINACTLALCSGIKTLPKVKDTSVVAADAITLSASLLRLDYASISDGGTPAVHSPLITMDFVNFSKENSGWEDSADGKPTHLVRMTDTSWMMWPNPDATWTGKTLSLIGSTLPANLTSSTETPALSTTLHSAYIHFCAWIYFQVLNNPERAASEFSIFDSLRKMNLQTATSTQGSQLSFRMGNV
jgi:hypothetical protein